MSIFAYKVLSDEELEKDKYNLIPDGDYHFTVIGATLEMSSKGNPMIKVILDFDGIIINDYISDVERFRWKIKHFMKSVGLEYGIGELDINMLFHRSGVAKVGSRTQKEGKYAGKTFNTIVDYLPSVTNNKVNIPVDTGVHDDIPF